jgi:hypothetical protein
MKMEKEKEIRKILKEMDDVYGHDFDLEGGRKGNWAVVEYQHDGIGLPVGILDALVSRMEDIGYEFVRIYVCPEKEKTLDIVFGIYRISD